jgi:phospholipase/lecithinase/hemolysin
VDNVATQIQNFSAIHPGGFAAADRVLYWAGANDILYYTLGGVPVSSAVANLLSLTAANLQSLESLGATEIVLPNQINSGQAPIWNGSYGLPAAARPYITAVTTQFNAALPGLIAGLEAAPGFDVNIVLVDEFSLAQAVISNPAAYGFTNVTDPAFPAHIGDAGQYLFWDPIHPTAAGQRLIADAVLTAIPEPGVLPLVGVGPGVVSVSAWGAERIGVDARAKVATLTRPSTKCGHAGVTARHVCVKATRGERVESG